MRQQVLHLVGQHAPALQVDVLRVARRERHGDQLQLGLLGRAPGLEVVAAPAGRDDVVPGVLPAPRNRRDVVARKLARRESAARSTGRGARRAGTGFRCSAAARSRGAGRRDCGCGRSSQRSSSPRRRCARPVRAFDAAPQREEGLAERVGDLSHEVQPDRIPVVDPLQGHSRDVRPQDFLRKCVLRKRAHAVKIRHCCAIIHGCFATVTIQNIPFTAAA